MRCGRTATTWHCDARCWPSWTTRSSTRRRRGSSASRSKRRPDAVAVRVCDTGTGIAPGEAARIFDRFRSGSQKANRRSYGLGLALARDVVNRHGGRLTLERTSPRGTCFLVELPPD